MGTGATALAVLEGAATTAVLLEVVLGKRQVDPGGMAQEAQVGRETAPMSRSAQASEASSVNGRLLLQIAVLER